MPEKSPEELYVDELYTRSRTLFVDLLKLGLSLCTGMIAALGFLVFSKDKILPLTKVQSNSYHTCMYLLLAGAFFAIAGWIAQAMYYTAWATDIQENNPPEKTRRKKWKILRDISFPLFAISFISGVYEAIVFISSFLKYQL